MPKPEMLIPHLRGLRADPAATRSYEAMSGGFFWSDERPPAPYSESASDYAMRFLLGYRASLIRGQPREELRPVWDAVLAACPGWPGFLHERSSPALAEELNRASKRTMRHLERLDRVLSGSQATPAAPPPQPNPALERTSQGGDAFGPICDAGLRPEPSLSLFPLGATRPRCSPFACSVTLSASATIAVFRSPFAPATRRLAGMARHCPGQSTRFPPC